jgi:hypothetical protein
MTGKITLNRNHITNLYGLSIGDTTVTATAAELNIMDGVTATSEEINAVDGAPLTMTTATTPGTNTCAVQLVFKDAAGVTMAVPTSGLLYISEVATGLSTDPVDGLAVLTNGELDNIIAHGLSHFVTTAAGLLGVTISHTGADSFWLCIILPSGKLLISDECVVNS